MNRYIYKGFTLVELLVVITIMTLVSIWWIWYFWWFLSKQELNSDLQVFSNTIRELDYKVKSKEIFDYELHLEINNTGSLLYTYYENYYDTKYNQLIDIDFNTWSWIISTNNWWELAFPLIWQTKVYSNWKLLKEEVLSWTWYYNYDFNIYDNYNITWYLSWEILNTTSINYFSPKNLDKVINNFIELSWIYWDENKNNTYSWVIIKNINNKKFFVDSSNNHSISTDLYLFFERNSEENFIKLTY